MSPGQWKTWRQSWRGPLGPKSSNSMHRVLRCMTLLLRWRGLSAYQSCKQKGWAEQATTSDGQQLLLGNKTTAVGTWYAISWKTWRQSWQGPLGRGSDHVPCSEVHGWQFWLLLSFNPQCCVMVVQLYVQLHDQQVKRVCHAAQEGFLEFLKCGRPFPAWGGGQVMMLACMLCFMHRIGILSMLIRRRVTRHCCAGRFV